MLLACDAGYGRHTWELTPASITNRRQLVSSSGEKSEADADIAQLQLVSACIYSPTTFIIKLALFILMYRIFWVLQWLRSLVYFGVLSTMLFYLSAMLAIIALCVPRNGQNYVISSQVSRNQGVRHGGDSFLIKARHSS